MLFCDIVWRCERFCFCDDSLQLILKVGGDEAPDEVNFPVNGWTTHKKQTQKPFNIPSTFIQMSKYIVTIALILAAAVQGKDCEKACKNFEDNNQKFLVHEGKVACKKHNISPRPTTEDICLSTFRALTRSTCMNYCDNSPLVPEVFLFLFSFKHFFIAPLTFAFAH
jgi:hypothetical protein